MADETHTGLVKLLKRGLDVVWLALRESVRWLRGLG